MKKILLIFLIINFHFPTSNSIHAQSAWDHHRFNLGIDYAHRPSQLELGTGLFAGHPERAMHVGFNYRLLKHWELGFYLGFQGCQITSHFRQDNSNGSSVGGVYYENGFLVNYGFLVQLHLMSFEQRNNSWADLVVRLGVGQGFEEDGAWGGFGVIWNATNHLSIQINTDIGGWFGGTSAYDANVTDNSGARIRSSIGLRIEL